MYIKYFAASVCAAAMLSSTAANAATTAVIDFNDATSGASYTTADGIYQFQSVNVQNATTCATGSCLQEVGQGAITTMTRVDSGTFDLLGFYFSLQGSGAKPNNVTIAANTGSTFTYEFGDDDTDGNANGLISLYDNANNTTGALLGAGTIQKSNGANGPNYVVEYLLGEFANVTSVSWSGALTANTRIDDVVVAVPMSPVPLPAGGLLLLSGLMGFGYIAKRRS